MAERATLAKEVFAKVKAVCGPDFLIEAQISAEEEAPGYTLEDFLDFCKALEGYVDIIQIRGVDGSATHVNGLNWEKGHPTSIDYAAAFKARGIQIACAPVGGYGDPALMEQYLSEGKTDLFAIARQFLADDPYYEKLQAGAAPEEIVPCIRCNGCHGHHTCAVNPRLGRQRNLFAPETSPKKVAVVGGGPAGLIAAITAANRGHSVTLYEAGAKLGGQLLAAGTPDYKWPIREYLDYLLRELDKAAVDVKLSTEATREMLAAEHYDHVIVAIGPVFTKAPIPGAESDKVLTCMDVFGHEDELPENIVVIGGSETGVETAMDLAEKGHKVTVLCRQKSLASDAPHAHYVTMLEDAWLKLDNFYWVKGIQKYLSIDDTGVTYVNYEGKEKRIDCDCVVMCTGARPNTEGCQALYGAADRTDFVGDCFRVGNVHFAVTTAFGAANQI